MTDAIILKDIRKSFQVEDRQHIVLDDFSLTIPADGITVLLGRSGCGKTTLLRLIGKLDTPDAGEIVFPAQAKTAFVFQEARLMPWLTVWKNIAFGLKKKEIDEQEIKHLITLTGLDGFAYALPQQLSGGMRQRCALARALALHPRFLLMDEPFAALDYFTREKMQQALLDIHKQTSCGILFVTHNIDEALTLGDRIVVLQNKKVKKIYTAPNTDATSEEIAAYKETILKEISMNEGE